MYFGDRFTINDKAYVCMQGHTYPGFMLKGFWKLESELPSGGKK